VTDGDIYDVPVAGGTPRALVNTSAYEGGAQAAPDKSACDRLRTILSLEDERTPLFELTRDLVPRGNDDKPRFVDVAPPSLHLNCREPL
jgi:hypothetical protein